MKEIKLNGVSFNLQAVALYASAEDFYNSPSHQHYWSNISEGDRRDRLTAIWKAAANVTDVKNALTLPNDAGATTKKVKKRKRTSGDSERIK